MSKPIIVSASVVKTTLALIVGMALGATREGAHLHAEGVASHSHPELPQWKGLPTDKVYSQAEMDMILCGGILGAGETSGPLTCPTAAPTATASPTTAPVATATAAPTATPAPTPAPVDCSPHTAAVAAARAAYDALEQADGEYTPAELAAYEAAYEPYHAALVAQDAAGCSP